jgi:uncharacterized protein (TIGR03435 family)
LPPLTLPTSSSWLLAPCSWLLFPSRTLLPICLAFIAFAQDAAPPKTFDAADVRVSPPGSLQIRGAISASGRLELRGQTMLQLITFAWDLDAEKVAGGPPWLNVDRFDITAKSSNLTSKEALHTMLQAILADRFKLAVHNEDRPLSFYALTLAKGNSPLKVAAGGGESGCTHEDAASTVRAYTCHNMTIQTLAGWLRLAANGYFDHPVVDRTGLKGAYDFSLRWTVRGQLNRGGDNPDTNVSLFDHLEKQLGIKVEAVKEPAPVLVVDHVNQTPTANPPGTSDLLPPAPTEFDVADIHPSKPGAESNFQIKNGRIEATSISFKDLLSFAYKVDDSNIVGEKWMDSDHFDIVAKTEPTTDFEALRVMLKNLVDQRFKLKTHMDSQTTVVYALTVPKSAPKIKVSDGSARSDCKLNVTDGVRHYVCQNVTMAQFAEKLPQIASGYVSDHPVVDLTGLKGAYDFTVAWAPVGKVYGVTGGRGGDSAQPGAGSNASDPGGMTLFEAVDKQLGLKLATQKHPMPALIVDHADRTPSDN